MTKSQSDNVSSFRAGQVAVIGRANAGKSSIINALVGEKVSVVSPVAQTTRRMVRAVVSEPGRQLVFVDTPGIRKATHSLGALLNRSARAMVTGADIALFLMDASTPPCDEDVGWMQKLAKEESLIFAVLNKVDIRCKRKAYETAWAEVCARCLERDPAFVPPPIRWFEVSAVGGQGLDELLEAMWAAIPEQPPLLPPDMLTDDPRPYFMADVIREQLNGVLRADVPHAVAVATEKVEDLPDEVRVDATIYVEKPSQRPILLGEKGRMIRNIRRKSEKALKEIYGKPHRLTLWIKVEKNWTKNYWLLKKFGYIGGA